MKNIVKLSLWLLIVLMATACGKPADSPSQERADRAKKADNKHLGDIVIGVAWKKNSPFMRGVELAKKELNNKTAMMPWRGERKIRLVKDDRISYADSSRRDYQKFIHQVTNSFADNRDLVAVIGHRSSSAAIPASVTYEKYGIVFIAPTSTNLSLTNHNFKYVFRMLPDNEKMGEQLAAYCHHMGYKRMAVLNDWGAYGEQLADSFIKSAVDKPYNITIVFHSSFYPKKMDFLVILSELRKKETDVIAELKKKDPHASVGIDAIFLSTGAKVGGKLIKQSREMGIEHPFVVGDSLEALEFLKPSSSLTAQEVKSIKKAAEKTVVPTVFNEHIFYAQKMIRNLLKENGIESDYQSAAKKLLRESVGKVDENLVLLTVLDEHVEKVQQFINNFKNEYGEDEEPNRYAALGYDALHLLAYAMNKAQSTVPIAVATRLRYMQEPWVGVTGIYHFKENGDPKNKKFYFKRLENGKFEFVTEIHEPELMQLVDKLKKVQSTTWR
jgi:branched-chain amino acid transport system substrate-binding protein